MVIGGLFAAMAGLAGGQDKSVRPGINDPFKNPDLDKYISTFEGESREIFTHRKEIVKRCGIKPGMVVADIGAGTGLFTRMFAKEVGPQGTVLAVEIAPKFIDHINKTCRDAGLTNVKTILGNQISTELPANSTDLAFICDTYHHFEYPHRTIASIRQALRPGGRIVLIDFHRVPGKSREWVLDHVRAGQEVFTREIESGGFRQVGEEKFLDENYFLRFEKVEPKPAGAGR
jgi:ubiquinone/menaquinone biosynthesis C-methylase UbiE